MKYRNKNTGELATIYSENKKVKTLILILESTGKGISMNKTTFVKNWEEVKND